MPMLRLSEGVQRSAAALLLTALVVWFLSGCATATRPADGIDLPQYARHTPSEMTDPPHRVNVPGYEIWAE
jgi:hypothetical protein